MMKGQICLISNKFPVRNVAHYNHWGEQSGTCNIRCNNSSNRFDIIAEPGMSLTNKNSGTAKIVGYTILLDKLKNKKAVIYAELEDKKRLILNSKNPEVIKNMENAEWIGKSITFKNGSLVY